MQVVVSAVTTARRFDHDVLLLTQEEGEEGLRRVADSALVDGDRRDGRAVARPPAALAARESAPVRPDRRAEDPAGLTCVDLDFTALGERSVEYLADLGHRCVALAGSPPEVGA